jgi:hypothetical protein
VEAIVATETIWSVAMIEAMVDHRCEGTKSLDTGSMMIST